MTTNETRIGTCPDCGALYEFSFFDAERNEVWEPIADGLFATCEHPRFFDDEEDVA